LRRALEELEKRGATYDDILSGEIGARWIQESCGDLELAKAAYELQHPGAHFIRMPKGL
jgi:hypothetical protein